MLLLLIEAVFAGLAVAGVAFIFWPAAMILAGVLGVWACERRGSRPATSERGGAS